MSVVGTAYGRVEACRLLTAGVLADMNCGGMTGVVLGAAVAAAGVLTGK